MIEIVGTPLIGDGLVLTNQSFGSTIEGLAIAGFNGGAAIHLETANNLVAGNLLGTAPSGTSGDAEGVWVNNASGNTIGGTTTGAANVIGFSTSGTSAGVYISGTANSNLVEGNSIGTDAARDNLNNQIGVDVAGARAT